MEEETLEIRLGHPALQNRALWVFCLSYPQKKQPAKQALVPALCPALSFLFHPPLLNTRTNRNTNFQNSNVFYWQKDRRNTAEDGIRIREKKKKIKRTVFLSCLWAILVCNRSIQDIRRYLTAPFPLVRYLVCSIFSLPYCLCDLVLLNLIYIRVCSSQL